jgi:hypothetical protein
MIDINFGSLFTVQLLHKFYADPKNADKNLVCPDFSIVPTNLTQRALAGNKVIARQYQNQLIAGIQSAGNSSPLALSPIATGVQMTFFMTLNNSLFTNYTNLPSPLLPRQIYYFTNRNNNLANSLKFLSKKIPVYSSGTTYLPGDVADDGTGNIFSAIKGSNSGTPFDTTHANHWIKVDNNQYVTANDLLTWMATVSTYTFTSAQTSAAISVLGYDAAAQTYTKSFISTTITFGASLTSFKLDLSSLQPGKYSLSVNGSTPQWIYINDELNTGNTFAVIDIFNDAAPASCQLVDSGQNLFSPAYTIFFLNRATIWQYILPSGVTGSVTDDLSLYSFTTSGTTATSQVPIPLSKTLQSFKLTIGANSYDNIACASPQRLSRITLGDSYPCSEIFLNYSS